MNATLCSGFGQFHTDEPGKDRRTPYLRITWADITAMVDNPQQVEKATAQWLIPSELASRTFARQEADGDFWALWADLDTDPPALQRLVDVLGLEITGAFDYEVYSSKGATLERRKARILIPLSQPLSGAEWVLSQQVLNDELQRHGIEPDRKSEGAAQLCYLPNRGAHYETASQRGGSRFDPLRAWADKFAEKRQALAEAAAAAEAVKEAAEARRKTAAARSRGTGGRKLIDAFNEAYTVADILQRAGYAQRADTYRHPASESGSYSASTKDGRVHSLSSADPLYTGGSGGGAHDAFSAWCVLEHGGDQGAAMRDAGDRMLTIGGESWNKVERREWAQQQAGQGQPLRWGVGGGVIEPPAVHPLAQYVDLDAEPMAPRFVIPGFVGYGLVIFAGAHGVGKTSTLLPLAMAAAGLHGPGDPLAPKHWRHVVYIVEDAEQALRIVAGIVKFGGLGLDMATVRERMHVVEACRLKPSRVAEVATTYREQFARIVDGVDVPPLVVIDTKSAVFSIEEENSNSEASTIVAMLKQSFQNLPVWLVGHVAKTSMNRADVAGLTLRGASAFEADANQVLYLVQEGEARYLVRGKTRFEAKWTELQIESRTAATMARDEYGDLQAVTLRWGIASPPEQSRKEAQQGAHEAARKADAAALRDEVRNLVDVAWQSGFPLNREGVKAAVGRRAQVVCDCIENLLSERWLHEVTVPSKDRNNAKRAAFLVNLTTEEHDAVIRGEGWPPAKLEVPASWRKPAAPSVPEVLPQEEEEVAHACAD